MTIHTAETFTQRLKFSHQSLGSQAHRLPAISLVNCRTNLKLSVTKCLAQPVTPDHCNGISEEPKEKRGMLLRGNLKVVHSPQRERELTSSSAMAIAKSLQRMCPCEVEFAQRFEKRSSAVFSSPSSEFRHLCREQLSLCSSIVGNDALFSVYIRPAGLYVTNQLELRQAATHPSGETAEQDDILVLVGTFGTQTSLRLTEAEDVPEHNAFVVPMIKDLFLVGMLVAERLRSKNFLPSPKRGGNTDTTQAVDKANHLHGETSMNVPLFSTEEKSQAIKIARTLATAYVMDQRTLLLQQTTWQKGVRMTSLMEQMHGPLSTIRTLSKMLLPHLKRNEIPQDLLEDILLQGDQMKSLLQELQDAFYQTKANLVHLWEGELNTIQRGDLKPMPKESRMVPSNNEHKKALFLGPKADADLELPMPPLALAASCQSKIRPCNVSKILSDLVDTGSALAHDQKQTLQLQKNTPVLIAAIDEKALRQALSNLIDSALLRVPAGGWVGVEAMEAPGGGVLVVIDDNGPDMTLMTQLQSLAPFSSELSNGRREDNIAWNFVAGVVIAREILEQYNSVLRMISPYLPNALLGQGGTHIEIWLPPAPPERGEK